LPRKRKTALSEYQKAYIKHCQEDFFFFCEHELKIVLKSGLLAPLIPNDAQKIVLEYILDKGLNRLAILKARQMGISTFIAGFFFWRTLFAENTKCIVLAHDAEAAAKLFKIYQTYYENLTEWVKEEFPLKHSTKKELVFAKHTGFITIATANSPDKLRGSTVQYLHCSEVAFWDKQKEVFTAAMQALTDRGCAFVETTANSFNYFYHWWRTENGYYKLFLPWFTFRDYQIMRDEQHGMYTDRKGDYIEYSDREIETLERTLTNDEAEYVNKYRLSPSQVSWMKWALENKCDGDWRTFDQEYPGAPSDAFLSSGDSFFEEQYEPVETSETECIIEKPVLGCTYVMGIDVASGSSDGDYSAAMVIDVTSKAEYRPVAWIYKKCPVHQFAKEANALGRQYNNALAVIEVNNAGVSVQEDFYLDEYPRLYRRYQYDKMAERYVEKLGFWTDATKRNLILNRLRKLVSHKKLKDLPPVLTNEMSSFVYDKNGKPDHSAGCHSDMIFATALALEGLDQIGEMRMQIFKEFHPQTPEDIVRFESKTGLAWRTLEPLGQSKYNVSKQPSVLGDNLDF